MSKEKYVYEKVYTYFMTSISQNAMCSLKKSLEITNTVMLSLDYLELI